MRSAAIIKGRKDAIFVGKGYVFTNFTEGYKKENRLLNLLY